MPNFFFRHFRCLETFADYEGGTDSDNNAANPSQIQNPSVSNNLQINTANPNPQIAIPSPNFQVNPANPNPQVYPVNPSLGQPCDNAGLIHDLMKLGLNVSRPSITVNADGTVVVDGGSPLVILPANNSSAPKVFHSIEDLEKAVCAGELSVGLPDLSMGLPELNVGLPDLSMGLPELSVGLPELSVGLQVNLVIANGVLLNNGKPVNTVEELEMLVATIQNKEIGIGIDNDGNRNEFNIRAEELEDFVKLFAILE
jgi:hypothetical protein